MLKSKTYKKFFIQQNKIKHLKVKIKTNNNNKIKN